MAASRSRKAQGLTHLDARGRARMVDVGDKDVTRREATAEAFVLMRRETFNAIRDGKVPKGDVLSAARIAGIQAAKRTHDLIPLCHPLRITGIGLDFELLEAKGGGRDGVRILATVKALDRTGVEMEALTAASVAALTVYDMAKALEKGMQVGPVRLLAKSGGKSGDYRAGGQG
ncbi:MAG: cyclic pyranopterin monophosphate synthase MoaC [Planctomycetaceae bacterium]|nr:cyclic pyranopterin monophosphate synthase MoaC [Planctomycetota bacterium]NUO16648.1 cyclic pyranopterin monophosphate synthase MoaC [Planctomycetaceae bacterium]